jgi:hypothetical protein
VIIVKGNLLGIIMRNNLKKVLTIQQIKRAENRFRAYSIVNFDCDHRDFENVINSIHALWFMSRLDLLVRSDLGCYPPEPAAVFFSSFLEVDLSYSRRTTDEE